MSIKAKNNEKVDHYGSDMIRILVKYTTTSSKDQELNLIVKQIPLEDGLKKTTLEKSKVFDVEVKVYSELQSIFQKYLDDSKIDTKLFCKCLYASLNPQPMLIFEDLTYEGFKRITKRSGNLEIALKALEKIAIWHAVSFKANGDGQKICQEFMDGFFKKDEWKNIPLFRDGPSFFLEMLKSHSEFEKYVSKFECLIQENPFSKVQKGFKSTEASLNVLNIGDIHYGNLMYSKDDVMLFDYQLVFWGPAVYDLIYVLYMYIDGGDRITRRDEIIYKYFETFTDTLKSMKYTGVYPRLTDLYKDFAISKDFGRFYYIRFV